jgi:hypothetical protein
MLCKLFHKIKRKEILPNSFNKVNITLRPKLDKDTTKRKVKANFPDESRSKNS